jgi:hypothetical protein
MSSARNISLESAVTLPVVFNKPEVRISILIENNVVKYISIKLVKALVDSALNTTTISFTPVVTASYTNSYIDEATYYGPGLARRV